MNIITPSGELYAKVYLDGDKLCISPSRYNHKYIMKLDAKVIPQLIAILKDFNNESSYENRYNNQGIKECLEENKKSA